MKEPQSRQLHQSNRLLNKMKNLFYIFFILSFWTKHYFNYFAKGSVIENYVYAYMDDIRNIIFGVVFVIYSKKIKDNVFRFSSIVFVCFCIIQTIYTFIALHLSKNYYNSQTSFWFVLINYIILCIMFFYISWSMHKKSSY